MIISHQVGKNAESKLYLSSFATRQQVPGFQEWPQAALSALALVVVLFYPYSPSVMQ